jgi:hypothetical protein
MPEPVHIAAPILEVGALRGIPSARFYRSPLDAYRAAEVLLSVAEVHGLGVVLHVLPAEGCSGSLTVVLSHVCTHWCWLCLYGGGVHQFETWDCDDECSECATAAPARTTAAHNQTRERGLS